MAANIQALKTLLSNTKHQNDFLLFKASTTAYLGLLGLRWAALDNLYTAILLTKLACWYADIASQYYVNRIALNGLQKMIDTLTVENFQLSQGVNLTAHINIVKNPLSHLDKETTDALVISVMTSMRIAYQARGDIARAVIRALPAPK